MPESLADAWWSGFQAGRDYEQGIGAEPENPHCPDRCTPEQRCDAETFDQCESLLYDNLRCQIREGHDGESHYALDPLGNWIGWPKENDRG